MLTDEQKRAIEMQAAQAIRRSWGGLNGVRARGIVDDIRAKVIEEGCGSCSCRRKADHFLHLRLRRELLWGKAPYIIGAEFVSDLGERWHPAVLQDVLYERRSPH